MSICDFLGQSVFSCSTYLSIRALDLSTESWFRYGAKLAKYVLDIVQRQMAVS